MKKISLFVLITTLLTLISCNSIFSADKNLPADVKWQLVELTIDNELNPVPDEHRESVEMFKSDGNHIEILFHGTENEQQKIIGTWSLSGNTITITSNNGDQESATVIELDSSKLVVKTTVEIEGETITGYLTYKKVD